MARLSLVRVNEIVVPDYAWPDRISIVNPRGNEVSLANTPVGAFGKPAALLEWPDGISVQGYQHWLGYVGATATYVQLSDLVLPNADSFGDVTHDSVIYTEHSEWNSAILWKIERDGAVDDGAQYEGGSFTRYLSGRVWVRITELTV